MTYNYGKPIEFYGLGQVEGGTIIGYRWTSNIDGIISGSQRFTKSNLSVGTHTIYFEVQNNNGVSSEKDTVVVIVESGGPASNKNPIAVIGVVNENYVNTTITFDGTDSYDPDGDEIVLYNWNFGDGETGNSALIKHTYSNANNYTVTLKVTDRYGKTNTASTYTNIISEQIVEDEDNEESHNLYLYLGLIIIVFSIASIILLIRNKK
jgi:PKD repeat protein